MTRPNAKLSNARSEVGTVATIRANKFNYGFTINPKIALLITTIKTEDFCHVTLGA